MSVLNNDIYGFRLDNLTFNKDAWLFGKFCSNDIYDFTADLSRIAEHFGRSIKTKLKLSPKGLTCGGTTLKILDPTRAASKEHYDLSSICDIHQDRKFANVLICIVKSRFKSFSFEVFTYKLQRSKDVVEFQDLFTELVTGTPRQRNGDQVDYRLSTLNMSDTQKNYGGTYASNGSAKTLRFAPSNSGLRNSNGHEPNYVMNRSTLERIPEKSRVRDVGLQANRERMNDADEQSKLYCRRTKVYSLRDSVLSDVACMTSPSRYYDDYDGQAATLTRSTPNNMKRGFAENQELYRTRMYSSPSRNEYGTRTRSSTYIRTGKEMQSRILSISDSSSSDEIQVQLTGESSRNGNYYRSQDYVDYSPIYERRTNGDPYNIRKPHF